MYALEKIYRVTQFYKYKFGAIKEKCGCCNGSGYYDHNGSPECGNCEGTGQSEKQGKKVRDLKNRQKEAMASLRKSFGDNLVEMAKHLQIQTDNKYQVGKVENLSKYNLERLIEAILFQRCESEMNTDRTIKAYYGTNKNF